MSGKVVGWAFEQDTDSPVAKLILVKLADNANEEGLCWPSVALIVRHTGLSERAVRQHLKGLADKGLIAIEPEIGPKGQSSNRYQLAVPPPARPAPTPLHKPQSPPARPAPTPTHHVQGHIDGTVNEPSLNLSGSSPRAPHGAAVARCSKGWESVEAILRQKIGDDNYDGWLGPQHATLLPGPPAKIVIRNPTYAARAREKFASALSEVFPDGWEIAA